MKDAESSFKVLNSWHHFWQTLHFWEYINKWLIVIKSCQNLLSESLLNVCHSFFLCCSYCQLRVLLHLQLSNCFLECIDEICILCCNLGRNLSAHFWECSYRGLSLNLSLCSCLRCCLNLGLQLHKAVVLWRTIMLLLSLLWFFLFRRACLKKFELLWFG